MAEMLALIGVVVSAIVGALAAWLVSTRQIRSQEETFSQRIELDLQRFRREVETSFSSVKIDIAHKYAELRQKDKDTASDFLNEISKQTAIGFLYINDELRKPKVWVRDNSNLLIGRGNSCDLALPDHHVSRQHAVIHTRENSAWILSVKPTNGILVDGDAVEDRALLQNGSVIQIYPYELVFFKFDIAE